MTDAPRGGDDGANGMRFDSAGLGFTARDGAIWVHYPVRGESGAVTYGAGFPIGDIPPRYFVDPPNEITRERALLWRELLRPR
ncbi:MAG TPA: hypothetical protein VFS05_12435 [Gemmatimonadaceae bacterium]|nr:hypothetical protein [Gemmatimonadaceae bacterium]